MRNALQQEIHKRHDFSDNSFEGVLHSFPFLHQQEYHPISFLQRVDLKRDHLQFQEQIFEYTHGHDVPGFV